MKDQKHETYWQETGRWVGYEESYDPQAGVWAFSEISYLTFKSLIQLRRAMNTGLWWKSIEIWAWVNFYLETLSVYNYFQW